MKVRHLRQIFHIGVNRAEIQRFQLFFFILFVHLIYWACQRSLIFLTASARKKTFDTLTILIGFMVELKIVPVVAIACFVPSLWSRIGTLYKHRPNIDIPICNIYYCFFWQIFFFLNLKKFMKHYSFRTALYNICEVHIIN